MDEAEDRILERALSEDRHQGTEHVDVIASGYEWTCPRCSTFNTEMCYMSIYTCSNPKCRTSFYTNPPEHAMG